jgi:hypothetical protein
MITASLSLLFALPPVARAAAFSVNIERIGGQRQVKGEVVSWSISVSPNTRAAQRVTLTVFNVADPAKGPGATTTRTATLAVGGGAAQRMEVATWGDRPKVRTTAVTARPPQTEKPQPQDPAGGPPLGKAAPEGPASRQPAAPAKPVAPAKPAAPAPPAKPTVPSSPSKPVTPAPNQPPAQAPAPGQKPSRR